MNAFLVESSFVSLPVSFVSCIVLLHLLMAIVRAKAQILKNDENFTAYHQNVTSIGLPGNDE